MTQDRLSTLLLRWPKDARVGIFRLPKYLLVVFVGLNALLATTQPGEPTLNQISRSAVWVSAFFKAFPAAQVGGTLPGFLFTSLVMVVTLLPWAIQYYLLQRHLQQGDQNPAKAIAAIVKFLIAIVLIQQIPMFVYALNTALLTSSFLQDTLFRDPGPITRFFFGDNWHVHPIVMLALELSFLFVAIGWPYLASTKEAHPFQRSLRAAFSDPFYWAAVIGIAAVVTTVLAYLLHRIAFTVMMSTSLSFWLSNSGKATGPLNAIDLTYRTLRNLLSLPFMLFIIKTCQEEYSNVQPKGN